MITFAVITLVVVLITSTHLLNWAIRKLDDTNGDNTGLIIVLCLVYLLLVLILLKYIILWGKLLV